MRAMDEVGRVAASLGRVCPSGRALVLSSATSYAVPVSPQRTEGGQPVQRFRKELIKVGSYFKQSDQLQFAVDRSMLDHWAATFFAMKVNGVKVPVPSGHTTDPDRNRGWVLDIAAKETLGRVIELVGERIKLAGTNDVSIYAEPSFTDGRGNKYEWPILHVALCTDPVVPGLRPFEMLMMSMRS